VARLKLSRGAVDRRGSAESTEAVRSDEEVTESMPDASRLAAVPGGRRRSGARRAADATIVVALATVVLALGAALAPRLAGFESLAITSGSMGKAAPVGSLVLTRSRLPSEVRPGDVIAVERSGHPIVVHRVVSVDASSGQVIVATKGDANASADAEPYPLPPQVPVMARAIPLIGYLVALLQVPLGWVLLIALPASAVAAATIRDLWRSEPQEQGPPTRAVVADLQPALEATRSEDALVNMQRQLEAARAEAEALRHSLVHAETAARAAAKLDPRVPALERQLEIAQAGIATLREALAVTVPTEAAAAPEPSPEPEPCAYLLFLPGPSGYRLVEQEGELPRAGGRIEADGKAYVVAKVGTSPLPGDRRRCAFGLPA
jgi:signal peptidase